MTCKTQRKVWYTWEGELQVTSLSNKLAFTLNNSLILFGLLLKDLLFAYCIFEGKGMVHE